MKHILIINGPNLNLLGLREPAIYGHQTYEELCSLIKQYAIDQGIDVTIKQSNSEGELVDFIQAAYGKFAGIIINPAAYTHTSIAILDALLAVGLPTVEIHLSDVSQRESYRQVSYIRDYCLTTISGLGANGYLKAIAYLIKELEK